MTISYKLYENDYLQYHLFEASISSNIRRQKRISYVAVIIAFLVIGFLQFDKTNTSPIYQFGFWIITPLLGFLFYYLYSSWSHKNHFKRLVKESYKNCFGKTDTVSITTDYIESANDASETKFALSEIDGVFETDLYFFIKMKSGAGIAIPKMEIAKDFKALKEELIKITARMNIPFVLK